MEKRRCAWVTDDPLYVLYHDREWGVPVHDDRRLFEFLILEGAQAGLSWLTILRKRENYRKAFAGFDPRKVARFDERKIRIILKDEGIVRNRLKVRSAVVNAKAFLKVQAEFGSFDAYLWRFAGKAPGLSRDLLSRGFKFVGPTICYAFQQACGLVQDHEPKCHKHVRMAT